MPPVSNPFVDYLRRYTTASPDHEAAFDEFLAQTHPPTGEPLRLTTRVEQFLHERFAQPDPPSVILTGNAGDGKTYLCRQILTAFGAEPDWDALADRPIERNGLRLHVVKDLSELGDTHGVATLAGLAVSLDSDAPDRYLIAANEGRLRHLLSQDPRLAALYQRVDEQLQGGPKAEGARLIVINLTEVTTSSFVPVTLQWMTAKQQWSACQPCEIFARCPVRHNAVRLSDPLIVGRVQLLYQLLEHLDIHVTVRDMLIHLAYTLTADQQCAELQRRVSSHRPLQKLAYYANIWGGDEQSAFRRKASVAQHLGRLQVGAHSLFEIDDFIVSGGEAEEAGTRAEHERLFAPAVDLDERRFGQDREAYLQGGAERSAADEARLLLEWLPHCRRKLFFEWHDAARVSQLVAFRHLDDYLRLLNDERGPLDLMRRNLVLGLNRAFSQLYLTDTNTLYVTTQYLHSTEQPRPLVRLTLPTSGISLRLVRRAEDVFDRAWPEMQLVFAPPSSLLLREPDSAPRPVTWRLNLLLFEYLMRLAHGGTFNVLSDECGLGVRELKDQLLSAFTYEPADHEQIEFFVAERRRYVLKQLRIDEQNIIRSGG